MLHKNYKRRIRGMLQFLNLLILFSIISIVLLDVGYLFELASGQENYCAPFLGQMSDNPLGYRMRGDRCEGIYIKEVGATTLLVASFMESSGGFDFKPDKALPIEWNRTPCNNAIRLRAIGLKRRLYYRMDTVRPPGSISYSWPSDVLAALNLQKKDIGIVGFTHCSVGKTEREVYVPLRIKRPVDAKRSDSYQIVLLPGVELSEVFITLAPVGSDGSPLAFLKKGEALKYGYYPAERGIEISISGLKASGIYYLEIGATLRGGGTSVIELWFFHPGP
jgi:hypothetical protein